MARLGCVCGAEMTNTFSPSKHVLNIYYYEEVERALEENPKIRLWDFYTGWDEKKSCDNSFQNRPEPVEYWRCSECGRIHEVQAVSCGKKLRTYVPALEEICEKLSPASLKEILPLTDIRMDEFLETDSELLLRDYVAASRDTRYFINEAETDVYAQSAGQGLHLIYREER